MPLATCPACTLLHVPRDSGLCPQCGADIKTGAGARPPAPSRAPAPPAAPRPLALHTTTGGAYAPAAAAPAAEDRPAVPAAPAMSPMFASDAPLTLDIDDFPWGSRVAGALLLGNVGATVLWLASVGGSPPLMGTATADLVLGLGLVMKYAPFRKWVVARAVLGLLALTPLLWMTAGPFPAVVKGLFSASLLLLVIPDYSRASFTAGTAVGALLLTLNFLLVGAGGSLVRAAQEELEPAAVTALEGARGGWRVVLPPGRWRLRRADAARRDNPAAEVWAVADDGRQVLVTTHDVPPVLDIDAAADIVALTDAHRGGAQVVERVPLPGREHDARLVRTRERLGGVATESWHALLLANGTLHDVQASRPAGLFSTEVEDLRDLVAAVDFDGPRPPAGRPPAGAAQPLARPAAADSADPPPAAPAQTPTPAPFLFGDE